MEKLVHSYLSKNYSLLKGIGKSYFIYAKEDIDIIYYGNTLIEQLETIFSVNKVLVKRYIISWAKILKPRNSLKKYWDYWGSIGLPLSMRISSRTISMDLVPVQPMAVPSG